MLFRLHDDIFVVLNNFLPAEDILRLAETSQDLRQSQLDFCGYALKTLRLRQPKLLCHMNNLYDTLQDIHEFIEVEDLSLYYYFRQKKTKYADVPEVLKEKKRYHFAWCECSFLQPALYLNCRHRIFFLHDAKKKLLIYSKKRFMLAMFLRNPFVEKWLCPKPLTFNYK